MGRRELEFEVERRREDRTPVRETEPDSDSEDEGASGGNGGGGKSTFSSWLNNPRTMDNMSYFVIAQTFVIVLSYGIPHMIKFWAAIKGLF
ncbi:hypothetical protein E2C01_031007 [Portunus trituberculatus]|uniref:Uncharacterized protein n=1 Tax=Portunus trituberculatus TaxID=210409 RepID=A0A5B7EYX3_PORTR|nr:hypothetical protein [Portunus trituberculatus]